MDNLTVLFDIFSRALQKNVHKSLKFSRGSFWTGGRINFFFKYYNSNSFKNRSGESDELGYKGAYMFLKHFLFSLKLFTRF